MMLAWLLMVQIMCGQDLQPVTNQWETRIQSSSDSSPAVGRDGTIYFGAWDGRFWALDPEGGRKWVFSTGREIKSSPAVGDDGTVYFGSRDRHLYALAPGGKLKWKVRTGGWVDASPALAADGSVCFGSWDGNFYALAPDGTKRWEFKTGGPVISSAAIATNGDIYFGSHDQRLYALSAGGQRLWEYKTSGAVLSSPALGGDGSVYVTSVDGYLHALDRGGGLKWRLQTGGVSESSPVVGVDGVIFVGVNRHLWAVSAEGKKLWERLDGENFEATPMVLADRSVCAISRYGLVIAIDQERKNPWHDLRWQFYLYGHGFASPGIGTNGVIYTSGKWNLFYALNTTAPLASTSWPKFRANARNTGRAVPAVVPEH
jgi:outer membrane protein assembly factor BamB